jgi:hypothetical protein
MVLSHCQSLVTLVIIESYPPDHLPLLIVRSRCATEGCKTHFLGHPGLLPKAL